MNNISKSILRWLLVLSIGAIILEIGLRITGLGYDDAGFEYNEKVRHQHKRNYSFLLDNPAVTHGNGRKIIYDVNGFISDTVADRTNINGVSVFFGDSYTEAVQVDATNRFVSLVEEDQGVVFQNGGVGSYSPLLMYRDYLRKKEKFQIKEVFIQLCSNDVAEDSLFSKELNEKNEFIPNALSDSDWYRSLHILRWFRKFYIRMHFKLFADPSKFYVDKQFAEHKSVFKTTLSHQILEKWIDTLHKAEVKVYLFSIPSRYLHFNKGSGEDVFYSDLEELYQNDDRVIWIDLKETFNRVEDFLFFENDIHLNEKGHQVVASKILSEIKKKRQINY